VLKAFLHEVQQLQKERSNLDARTFCRRFWTILKPLYVVDPKNASRIQWDRCGFATEMNFGEYWMRYLLPSIRAASPTSAEIEGVRSPVLVVHGKKDRSAPYGGGREWAMRLPDARLLTVEETAHAPWIEAPHRVKRSIRTFLDGDWPDGAEGVDAL
jgi:pimeloyl-ACP methyl ester carboxylesterase